jgi:hypothetical protein
MYPIFLCQLIGNKVKEFCLLTSYNKKKRDIYKLVVKKEYWKIMYLLESLGEKDARGNPT